MSRHGIRGPFGPDGMPPTKSNLQIYTTNGFDFPTKGIEWGTSSELRALVTPKITAHGELVILKMGRVSQSTDWNIFHPNLKESFIVFSKDSVQAFS